MNIFEESILGPHQWRRHGKTSSLDPGYFSRHKQRMFNRQLFAALANKCIVPDIQIYSHKIRKYEVDSHRNIYKIKAST